MWTSILLCCVLVGLGAAQEPHRCISPPEMSFKAYILNHPLTEFIRYSAVYDGRGEREAYFAEKESKHEKNFDWGIGLHREKVFYEIDVHEKTCKKFPYEHFHRFGVPEKARFVDSYEIGGPGESIEAEEWYEPHLIGGTSWAGVFSRRQCYPISSYLFENHKNKSESIQIFDVVEGIDHPEWFIPPSYCEK